MPHDPNSNAPKNRKEKSGKERAKDAMEFSDTLDAHSGDQRIRNDMKEALQKLFNDTAKLPNSDFFRANLPEKGNIKQINQASMEDIKKWSKTIKQRREKYEQQVNKISPAATPDKPAASAAPAPAAQAPAAPAQPATPTATPEQVSGLRDAIKAESPVNKLMSPPSFPTAGAPQAAQPFAPTAPQVGPTAAQAPAAQPQNPRAMTTPPAGAATVPSFKAQLDAKLAAMHNPAPAASSYKQLQPQDEVAAMEEQMIGGGYQIPKGGLKKDGAGYHVIDEQGRKLMVAPTASMRSNVQERLNGMAGLSNTLKPGQTMTDKASAYMGRAPQPVANTTVRDAQAKLDQMHVADQQAVMKAYPLIGNKGGAMNKLFTDAYHAAPKGTDMMKLANNMFAKGGTHFDAYNSMPKTPFEQPAPVGPTVPAEQQSPLDVIKAQSPAEKMMKPPASPALDTAYRNSLANRPQAPNTNPEVTGQMSAYTMNGLTAPPTAPVSKIEDGMPSANLQPGLPLGTGEDAGGAFSGIQGTSGLPTPPTTAENDFKAKEILGKPVDDPYAGLSADEIMKSKRDLYQQKGAEEEAARVKQFKANEEKFNQYEGAPARAKAREYDPSRPVF